MHRYRFLLFRPLQLLPVLLGISIITFAMVRAIPGDPARILLGVRSTPAALARIRAQFGLDEPLWVQYGYFLRNLLQGELGKSIVCRVDTLKLINSRLEPTLWLVLGSMLLAVALTVPLASVAARQRGRRGHGRGRRPGCGGNRAGGARRGRSEPGRRPSFRAAGKRRCWCVCRPGSRRGHSWCVCRCGSLRGIGRVADRRRRARAAPGVRCVRGCAGSRRTPR